MWYGCAVLVPYQRPPSPACSSTPLYAGTTPLSLYATSRCTGDGWEDLTRSCAPLKPWQSQFNTWKLVTWNFMQNWKWRNAQVRIEPWMAYCTVQFYMRTTASLILTVSESQVYLWQASVVVGQRRVCAYLPETCRGLHHSVCPPPSSPQTKQVSLYYKDSDYDILIINGASKKYRAKTVLQCKLLRKLLEVETHFAFGGNFRLQLACNLIPQINQEKNI